MMPWKIQDGGQDCPFEVVKADSGERVACHPTEEKAKAHMAALYANTEGESMMRGAPPVVENRNNISTVADVKFVERIVTVVAVPYDSPAFIPYRGDVWTEMFERGAFNASIKHMPPGRIRANRDHDRSLTVGKAVKFWPDRDEGLVADIYVSDTERGRETLQLAADDCLSASIGFGIRKGGQKLDPVTKTRRVTDAFLDHISFVESPAYENANVLQVRSTEVDQVWHSATPNLDQSIAENEAILRWTSRWFNK